MKKETPRTKMDLERTIIALERQLLEQDRLWAERTKIAEREAAALRVIYAREIIEPRRLHDLLAAEKSGISRLRSNYDEICEIVSCWVMDDDSKKAMEAIQALIAREEDYHREMGA